MTEVDQQNLITSLISKGNELIKHAKNVSIFCSSVAYAVKNVRELLSAIKNTSINACNSTQIDALKQIQILLENFEKILPPLTVDNWKQPALNWPVDTVHKRIDEFRDKLFEQIPRFGLDLSIVSYSDKQAQVNKKSDLKQLKESLTNLMQQKNTTKDAKLQHQIETKLKEIHSLLHSDSKKSLGSDNRPTEDTAPIQNIQHRFKDLFSPFKGINIPLSDIRCDAQIGSGGFGTVFKALRLSTAEIVAVKELRQDRLTVNTLKSLRAEVETMCSVHHQFVLELVGAHIEEPYRIITRFCSGKSLFDRLHRQGNDPLTSTDLTKIAYQVACGMAHLHSMSIVHRDLKTLNILIDEYQDGLVADFGLSGMMKDNQELAGGVGTPHYTAPEVLMQQRYGPKVDTFSYGVVLWEMLIRKVPYANMSHIEIYEHVVTRCWRLPIPNDSPEGMKKLIARCWNKNPNDRPDFYEIVKMFENEEVYFPGSEKIDFEAIKATKHCPPLDLEYALSVLTDTSHENFTSVSYFIVNNYDDTIKRWIRENHIIDKICKSNKNIDSILLLASVALKDKEYKKFMDNGGLDMFKKCIYSGTNQMVSAALRFGLQMPDEYFSHVTQFLDNVVSLLSPTGLAINGHILQFLTRFDASSLNKYYDKIGQVLVASIPVVNNQQTYDAIVTLLKPCRQYLTSEQLYQFYHLISEDFIVPQSFAETLIEANDLEHRPELILNILKATARSNITDNLIKLLRQCLGTDPTVFQKLVLFDDMFTTLENLIEKDHTKGALFMLYCICGLDYVRQKLANHKLLGVLIQMRTRKIQRLQIFTLLCLSEEFCSTTTYMDGIIPLLVSALSEKELIRAGVMLIGALSTHMQGVTILTDHCIIELFVQLYLSSLSGDITSTTIFRNIVKNCGEVPQASLVISCLMHDIVSGSSKRCDILETTVALVAEMPHSIQDHDLQKIVLPIITSEENPRIVYLALSLLNKCDSSKLRNFYPQVLKSVYFVLDHPKFMYTDIIENCLEIIYNISGVFDLTDFLEKTNLLEFVQQLIQTSGKGFKVKKMTSLISKIRVSCKVHEPPSSILV